jgi:hypothetical protein
LQVARCSGVSTGKRILPRFAACSRNEEAAGKCVACTRAVDPRWEWMRGECGNVLTLW